MMAHLSTVHRILNEPFLRPQETAYPLNRNQAPFLSPGSILIVELKLRVDKPFQKQGKGHDNRRTVSKC